MRNSNRNRSVNGNNVTTYILKINIDNSKLLVHVFFYKNMGWKNDPEIFLILFLNCRV